MREKKIFCIYGCFSVPHYIKGRRKSDTIEFLDTRACINKQHWQSSGIIIFLCKYYIVISDTLVGFFLDVLFLLLAVRLSELSEKPRRNKDWVTEKSTKKNLCERHHFFDCTASLLCHFLLLSLSTLFP